MTIGEAIKKARKNRGLSRAQLAKKSGVSLPTLAQWESDKFIPTVLLLSYVADVLEMSIDDLIGRERRA